LRCIAALLCLVCLAANFLLFGCLSMNCIFVSIVQLTAAVGLFATVGCAKAPPATPASHPVAVRDAWDIYFMHGKRIGYAHTQATLQRDADLGRDLVDVERLDHLAVKRDGQMTEQDIRTRSVETPEGVLVRFETEMQMGGSPMRMVGHVQGDRLLLEVTTAGSSTATKTSVPWAADGLGPLATEQTLLDRPMQPGERRTLKTLMIGLNQMAEVEMTAKDYEPTALLGGTHDLLRIDTVSKLPGGPSISGTVWCDRTGETQKTSSEAMGLESFRATKAEALEHADVAELDLMITSIVKVDPPLEHPAKSRRVRYRVHLDGGDPASVFATGPGQKVTSIDAHTADIVVEAIRPGQADGNRDAPADPPTDADRRPNDFVQSVDPLIQADAAEAADGQTDPWAMAKALERYVYKKVTNKNYGQAFASAAEVAKSLEGDCTEHAVFLAALARAKGIPARVAIGLVYMERDKAFGYHMWTEVYIDGRWIPIDGTLAQGGTAADHLKIGQTNLEGTSVYSTFLPVVEILGRLKIKIESVE
jgi:hypothetical protein